MKKLILAAAVLATAATCFAGQTSTFLKNRVGKTADVTMGKWNWQFKKAKAYAVEKKIPLIAVWSNGDSCSHCTRFENALDTDVFKNWMKESGCVFYFTYPGDGGEGKKESSTFHWIRGNNTSYPFVRIYWPSGKVDITTVGDVVDADSKGNPQRGSTGGKAAVAYFKKKLKAYKPVLAPDDLPYQIAFDPNYPTAADVVTNGAEMETLDMLYAAKTNLTACAFACSNVINGVQYAYSFNGWAKTATGSVAFKDAAAVQGLTDVSNKVVTLYARWTKMAYGPYYTGLSKTVKPVNYLGKVLTGYKPASTPAGLTWSKSKYYWTGKPTKAGVYKVTFKKSGASSLSRTFVIVKDAAKVDGFGEPNADGVVTIDNNTKLDSAVSAVSGDLTGVTVANLPAGLVYLGGKITGRPTEPNTLTEVTVKGVSVNGQTLTTKLNVYVKEVDTLLLNGMAHADEVWTFAGETNVLSLAAKICLGDDAYRIAPVTAAVVTDESGAEIPGIAIEEGRVVCAPEESGVYSCVVTASVGEDEELSTTFTVNALEGEEPEPEGLPE